ncbi:hypothetical protein [Haliangium ochraceum]|uniref:Lipoprotein n=1 Tax=Haliangium ochraceum (strain DSM 14365 / JCM 11303 / SMP-2) TaxID=502025 RepID=D0LQ88_HALO1|nr:hypothetical protein [Haliangium ochraceum]ACY18897.1 hypothetical protein Hoch_6428 [Haliangium ochraceum DSM 14365]
MATKKLLPALLFFGGVMQAASGCIIVGDDSSDPPPPPPTPDAAVPLPDAAPLPELGEFYLEWSFVSGEDNAPAGCPNADDVIELVAQPKDGVEGDEIVAVYDCATGSDGYIVELEPGYYDVWVELRAADETLLAKSAVREEVYVDYDEVVEVEPYEFSIDHAYFALTWTILEAGEPSTCEAVGGDTVEVATTVVDTAELFVDGLACEDGFGYTPALPVYEGELATSVSLLDAGDFVLGQADPAQQGFEYGNQYVDLGNFTFDILD